MSGQGLTKAERERLRKKLNGESPDFQLIFKQLEEEARGGSSAPVARRFLAPMPTLLCRISPFFPLGVKRLKNRPVFREMVVTRNVGERVIYHGPQLSTYEEDVLVPLLGLIYRNPRQSVTRRIGRPTFHYQGPLYPLLRRMGRSIGPWIYQRAVASLKLMNQSGLELERERISYRIDRIVSEFSMDRKTKKVTVILNPFFFEAWRDGQATLLDVARRAGLSRPILKALYRFISPYPQSVWRGHFMLLVPALNLNPKNSQARIRSYLKKAVADFQQRGLLDTGSGFESQNIIRLARPAPETGERSWEQNS